MESLSNAFKSLKTSSVGVRIMQQIDLGEDHEDSSDDVPLLFSTSSASMQPSSHELELVDHCHCKPPSRDNSHRARRQLCIATVLCTIFVAGEVVGGYISGSLAIMSDAAHMVSDLGSFGVSLLVLYMSDRKPTKSLTFGYHRAEALGALSTLVIIWYVITEVRLENIQGVPKK